MAVRNEIPIPLRVAGLAAGRRSDDEVGPVFTYADGLVIRTACRRACDGQDDQHLTCRGPSAMSTQLSHDRVVTCISLCRCRIRCHWPLLFLIPAGQAEHAVGPAGREPD